jgi:diaminopimelate epimerase
MNFTKIHGTGNDFVVIEDLDNEYLGKESELAAKLCDRHFGIGGDGILLVRKSELADISMVIINSDGSYASMCGNGVRCFAKYVWEKGLVKKDVINVETGDGVKVAYIQVEGEKVFSVKINMGTYSFDPVKIPSTFEHEIVNEEIEANGKRYSITTLLMGVPHTVIFGSLEGFNTEEGKAIERLHFFPQGTNVNFCEVIDGNNVRVKTWERGAGPTLACGTGSCAAVIAAKRLGLTEEKVQVQVPGGILDIELTDRGVFMSGAAVITFEGKSFL